MTVGGETILVTGATGNIGYAALKSFLRDPTLTREKYKIRAACYKKSPKINNVKGLHGLDSLYEIDADNYDADLDRAFSGVDYAFLIPSSSRQRVQHIRNYVDAAKRNNLKFICLLSTIRPEEHVTTFGEEFRMMEEIVETAANAMTYCFLRTTLLSETLYLFAPDIRKGVLPLPIKDGRFAPMSSDDAAQFAAKIMTDVDRHASKAYHLTGPEILDGQAIAAVASRALGRSVRFVNVSAENCKKLMLDSGLEEWLADGFNGLFHEVSKNRYAFETSDLVTSFLGRPPKSLHQFFTEHSQRFTEEEGEDVVAPPPAVEDLKKHRREKVGDGGGEKVDRALSKLKEIRSLVEDAINCLEE